MTEPTDPNPSAASEDPGLLKRRLERLERLYQVSNVIHATLDPQEALTRIVNEAVGLMEAASGSVVLINPHNNLLEIHAAAGLPADVVEGLRLRMGDGLTGWVAANGRAARVNDVTRDERYVRIRSETCSELAVPLEVDGETRGVLNVDADRPDAFTAEDEQLLMELATQAAKVIQNTWLYEQVRLKARLFETLTSVGQAINSTLDLDEALRVIVKEACSLMRARMCSLLLLDPTETRLELRASFGAGDAYKAKPALDPSESLLGVVVRRRRPLQVQNVQASGRYQHVEIAASEGLVSLLSVPLVFRDRAIGALNVYTAREYTFSNEEITILTALAELSAIAIEKARLYERTVDVEEQLRRTEKLSALGLLAAEVAHEIRNPLTVMKMLYYSLNLTFDESDARAQDARIIGEKMEHLNRIVERVLDLSRNAEPVFAPLNLNSVVEELALLVRHKLRNQGIQFTPQLDPALPDVPADAIQIGQALLNLILNAAEAMSSGGELSVRTSTRDDNELGVVVCVDVSDTGHGMRDEDQSKAFTSLLNTSKQAGTGLGLAIVARIVEAHKGTITLNSQPGRGTTVSLSIPVRAEAG